MERIEHWDTDQSADILDSAIERLHRLPPNTKVRVTLETIPEGEVSLEEAVVDLLDELGPLEHAQDWHAGTRIGRALAAVKRAIPDA